jgi:RNA polymerase sigma-70 factor (ECF subfamily)
MPESLRSEKELLVKLKAGDKSAFEQIYRLYSNRLFGNLLKLLQSETEAQEILQEVFLKIWQNRALIDPEKSFRSYLFKIAENKVFDFFRKAAMQKRVQNQLLQHSDIDTTLVDKMVSDKENEALLAKAIDHLPPQRKQVFVMVKLQGKTYKEVSDELGISSSTISDHIVKATKSIRDYLTNSGEGLQYVLILAFFTSF